MILNHVWQSTVFAGLAALLALVLRDNRARTRYWLWLAASLKFLIPFSLLVTAGRQFEWSTAPIKAQQLSVAVAQITQPFAPEQIAAVVTPSFSPHHASMLPQILSAVWICGFAAVAFSWWRRWRRIHQAVRMGSPLYLGIELRVLSSLNLMEPGVFGIFRPVLLLPEGIATHLTAAQLEAIIAHELCHVRRRDNLTAALHMAVEAIFWFHPLVWWLGARLVEERERACDEEVLQLGSEPQVYAESILKTCRFYLEAPLACMSGITGSDLKKRIVRIMTRGLEKELSLWRKLLLIAAGVAALASPVLLGLMNTPQGRAQASASIDKPVRSFEVASIKANHDTGPRGTMMRFTGARFTGENVTVKSLLEEAYHVKDSQLSGAPSWIDSERYDIDAKLDDATVAAIQKLNPDERREQLPLLFQSLLADRFKLAFHREAKELPVYALLVAKNGPKFKETTLTAADFQPPHAKGPLIRMMGPGQLTMTAVDLNLFADVLSREVGRAVVDKTGLKAKYDFALKWTPEQREGPAGGPDRRPPDAPAPDANGPTVFTAVQEQLGLKLESQKSPLDVLVIEHIERPTEN